MAEQNPVVAIQNLAASIIGAFGAAINNYSKLNNLISDANFQPEFLSLLTSISSKNQNSFNILNSIKWYNELQRFCVENPNLHVSDVNLFLFDQFKQFIEKTYNSYDNSYYNSYYFMQMAKNASDRSKFPDKEKEGAVIVNHRVALGIGWNGFAEKLPDEEIANKLDFRQHTLSAIENAFIFTTVGRFDIKGATVYCTHFPNWRSAQFLIQYEVKNVFYKEDSFIKEDAAENAAEKAKENAAVMYILNARNIEISKFP